MKTERNKGRAVQMIQDAPTQGLQPILQWLLTAVIFLLTRYIKDD
jgi:hypothetical protein